MTQDPGGRPSSVLPSGRCSQAPCLTNGVERLNGTHSQPRLAPEGAAPRGNCARLHAGAQSWHGGLAAQHRGEAAPGTARLRRTAPLRRYAPAWSQGQETMIVAFETEELRRICEDSAVARSTLGDDVAANLAARVADLRAAPTIGDLPVGRPRVGGPELELLTVELGSATRMVWVANHSRPSKTPEGKIDWDRTNRIRLLEIGRSDS